MQMCYEADSYSNGHFNGTIHFETSIDETRQFWEIFFLFSSPHYFWIEHNESSRKSFQRWCTDVNERLVSRSRAVRRVIDLCAGSGRGRPGF